MLFAHRTILGKRIRAVASNPMLADITRLQPQTVYIYVIAIASALVCLPGILVPLDLGLQPYNGVTPLLTATIAMIAGGVGSITGAFVLSVAIAVAAEPVAAGDAGRVEYRRDVLHLRDLHAVPPHRAVRGGALMDFLYSYIVLAEIYVLLGLSTNLLVGIVGIFSVSQAAVFGVGAYVVAHFLMASDALPFIPSLAIAAACCVALNILVTLPSLRVSGDYFVVTSFGIQLLATAVFTNWTAGTGGANGLPGIPPPDVFGWQVEITAAIRAAVHGRRRRWAACASDLIMRAPFGRLLRAIREDETAVAAAGKNVLRAKVSAAALAGAFAGTRRRACTPRSSASSIRRRSTSTHRSCC